MAGKLRKRLRHRFGIAAPRVAVRTHVAWYWRWLGIVIALALSVALAAWMYDAGRRFAGFDSREVSQELAELRAQVAEGRAELDRLRVVANAADSRLSIERTAQQKLAQQIRGLELDNARLREELAIFESMLSSAESPGAQGLSINRFKVEPDALPGEYRYRLLLLASGTRREREFQGRLELVVGIVADGRSANITFPDAASSSAPAFRLAFKNFHRVEGVFRVDPKAKVEKVQVRVFEAGSGERRATQSVTL
jgi:hypothetical protein